MKKITTLALMFCFLLSMAGATYAIEFPAQHNVPLDKDWSIKFNRPVDTQTVLDLTVYIKDENNKYVPATISFSDDKRTVVLTPNQPYLPGTQHKLFVDSVSSEDSQPLAESVQKEFVTVNAIFTAEQLESYLNGYYEYKGVYTPLGYWDCTHKVRQYGDGFAVHTDWNYPEMNPCDVIVCPDVEKRRETKIALQNFQYYINQVCNKAVPNHKVIGGFFNTSISTVTDKAFTTAFNSWQNYYTQNGEVKAWGMYWNRDRDTCNMSYSP